MSKKERQAVWLYPETKKLIDTHMIEDNCRSQSEYIEKAVKFYTGYCWCILFGLILRSDRFGTGGINERIKHESNHSALLPS